MNVHTNPAEPFSTSNEPPVFNASRILRLPDVLDRTGLSRSGLYERVKDGDFPASVGLGGRTVGWLEVEVNHWIADRAGRRVP